MRTYSQVFIRNSIITIAVLVLLSIIPIFSCSYSRNQIPLEVSYFLPEETGSGYDKMEWQVEELSSSMFKPISKHFNPGYYDGEMWLEIKFNDPEDLEYYEDCILDFGLEPLEYAKLYVFENNQWKYWGIAGRSIPIDELSIISWRQSIGIKLTSMERQDVHTLRIKMNSKMGSPVYVKLLQRTEWEKNSMYNSILNYVLSGIFLISIIFLFSFGIFLHDFLYTQLSILGLTLFVVLIQLKGSGPVFFWNNLAVHVPQNKIIYILCLSSILITFSVFKYVSQEIPEKKGAKVSMHVISALVGFSILLNLLITNAKINAIIFNMAMFSSFIILEVMLSLVNSKQNSPLKFLTSCWTIAFALTIIRQAFHFLRTFLPWPFLSFFDTDRYYTYDFIYSLITIPALYITSRRIIQRYKTLFSKYRSASNEVHKLQAEKKLINQITKELLESNTILINSFSLPESPSKEENEKTKLLIDKTLCFQADITTALCLVNEAITPNYSPIILTKFIDSTINIVKTQSAARQFSIENSSSIPESYTVYSEPRLLEFIFGGFVSTYIQNSARNSFIHIDSSIEDNTLSFIVTSSLIENTEDETQKPIVLQMDNALYALVFRSVQFLNGEIKNESGRREFKYTIKIPFKNVNQNFINNHTLISSSMYINEKRIVESKDMEIPVIPDNVLTIGNKIPTILLIEDDENTCSLLKKLLTPHCNLLTLSNGIDAWNSLSSLNQKMPDLILCEYELPKMTGYELFSKTKGEATMENIPFVFLLDMNQQNEELTLIQKGAAGCIVKPFTADSIINKLLSILTLVSKAQNSVLYHINKAVAAGSSITTDIVIEKQNETFEQVNQEESNTIMLNSSQEAIFHSAGLSKREQQIALLILNGKSDKQIGDTLGISPQTVATHNKNLFKKLNIHSRIELMNKLR